MTFSKIGKKIRKLIFHKIKKLFVKIIHLITSEEDAWAWNRLRNELKYQVFVWCVCVYMGGGR